MSMYKLKPKETKKKEYVYEVYSGDKVVYIQRKKKKRTYFFVAYTKLISSTGELGTERKS